MKEKISVIIPTKNRIKETTRCLKSIEKQTRIPEEVIIVDSSATQNLKQELKKFKNLKIKYLRSKPGLTHQRNVGLKKCKGQIVIFSDDDTIWDRNYVEEIARVFQIYPKNKIGGVSGTPILKKKSLSRKILIFIYHVFAAFFFLTMPGNGKFRLSGRPTILHNTKKITKSEFLYGFSMAFRTDTIKKLGFDENLGKGGYSWVEDDDIAYRTSRKYQNFYTPFAKIIHLRTPSSRDNIDVEMKKRIEHHYYLFKKNLPQDLKHKIAFYISILGFLIKEFIIWIIKRDIKGVKGLLIGIKNIRAS